MSKETQKLASLLGQREEQLWQLQNSALRLATEGPSGGLCDTLADGIEELHRHLGESGPSGLSELLAELTVLLRVGRLDRAQTAGLFSLVEALVAVQRGEGESALQRALQSSKAASGSVPEPQNLPAGRLRDKIDDVDPEDIRMFSAEAREHVQRIEASLIELEATHNLELVGEIFRGVHSIKGGAQYLGLEATATLAHRAETLLDRMRSRTLEMSSSVVTTLLRSVDVLSSLVDALEQGKASEINVAGPVQALEALIARDTDGAVVPSPDVQTREDASCRDEELLREPVDPAVSVPE
jgi:HPt (histidine-containing phosphotransfer) domain-containing protein